MTGAGTLVVSLDFELLWGVRDRARLGAYERNLQGSREVIPRLLERFAAHGVRATWATVGMLFCESREHLRARLPARLPAYADPALSPYADVESVGDGERSDPLRLAPSLIRLIADTPGQEVATHTFSHFYCLEPGQDAEDFDADLAAAVAVARDMGIRLRSIVFPRNQVNASYLPICRAHGLVAYRGPQRAWMYGAGAAARQTPARRGARLLDAYLPLSASAGARPARRAGLLDIPASRFFRPRSRALRVLEPRKVGRIAGELERAARDGGVYHLWWHPHNFGVAQDAHLAQLDAVLSRFSDLRDRGLMRSLTMAELAEELET